jgi:hypothetical protein
MVRAPAWFQQRWALQPHAYTCIPHLLYVYLSFSAQLNYLLHILFHIRFPTIFWLHTGWSRVTSFYPALHAHTAPLPPYQAPIHLYAPSRSRSMGGPAFGLVFPDDADVELAKKELQGHVPDHLLTDVLLLHSIPEDYREHVLEAFGRMSACPETLRLQYLSRVSRFRGSHYTYTSSASQPSTSPWSRSSYASASSNARSSFASINNTPATSAPISPFTAALSPHSVIGNSTHAHTHTHTPALSTTAGEPVPDTPSGAVNQAADHQTFSGQQSSEHCPPSSRTYQFFGVFRPNPRKKAQNAGNAGAGDRKGLKLCPVCGYGMTRFTAVTSHAKTQCLRPKITFCHGCSNFYSREAFQGHPRNCSDQGHEDFALPTRKQYASCLTGRLFSNEADLLTDARELCMGNKPVPPGDQNLRLKALLGSDEIHQEMQKQCIVTFNGDPAFWRRLLWDDNDAMHFSSMAEFGLQPVEASSNTNSTFQAPGAGLEQHGLGIVNLQEYVTRVIESFKGVLPPPAITTPEQGPVNPSGSQTHEFQVHDVQSRHDDAQARALSHLQTERRVTGEPPHSHGQPQPSNYEGYNSGPGPSDTRPMSVVMGNYPPSFFEWN